MCHFNFLCTPSSFTFLKKKKTFLRFPDMCHLKILRYVPFQFPPEELLLHLSFLSTLLLLQFPVLSFHQTRFQCHFNFPPVTLKLPIFKFSSQNTSSKNPNMLLPEMENLLITFPFENELAHLQLFVQLLNASIPTHHDC